MDEGQTNTTVEDVNMTPDASATSGATDAAAPQNNDGQSPDGEAKTLQDGSPEDKPIPYSRFVEAQRAAKAEVEQLKQELAQVRGLVQTPKTQDQPDPLKDVPPQQAEQIKQVLKGLGFVSQEEIQRRENDQRLNQTLSSLEQKYNGTNGLPKFDRQAVVDYAVKNGYGNAEAAFKAMHEAEFTNHLVQQAIAKSKGIQTEASNGSGSSSAGPSNDDLAKAAADPAARQLLLKRIAKSSFLKGQ